MSCRRSTARRSRSTRPTAAAPAGEGIVGRADLAGRQAQGHAGPVGPADRCAGGVAGRIHRCGRTGGGAGHRDRRVASRTSPPGWPGRRTSPTTPAGDHSATAPTSPRPSPAGAASNGKYKGVAPEAKLLRRQGLRRQRQLPGVRDPGRDGMGRDRGQGEGRQPEPGRPGHPGVDPLEEAVNRLTTQTGTLFVIAAGNEGPGEHASVRRAARTPRSPSAPWTSRTSWPTSPAAARASATPR